MPIFAPDNKAIANIHNQTNNIFTNKNKKLMKKIFTLIAAALMAVSANAKETIDFSAHFAYGEPATFGGWEWKGVQLSTGELITDDDAKTADDSGVTYFDASAFDYVVISYSACKGDILLIAQYNCKGTIGQYGPEFNQEQVTVDASKDSYAVALKLNASMKSTINSIAIQGGNGGGTITIDEVYFATEAEWEAVKPAPPTTKDIDYTTFAGYQADQDAFVFAAGGAGWYNKWYGTLDPSEYPYLIIEVESSTGDVQFLWQGTSDGSTPDHVMISKSEEPQTVCADLNGWSNITQFAFQNFNFADPDNENWDEKSASAQETTMKISAMYYSKEAVETSINEVQVAKTQNAAIFNLAGQQVSKAVKGVYIQNGKKFVVK